MPSTPVPADDVIEFVSFCPSSVKYFQIEVTSIISRAKGNNSGVQMGEFAIYSNGTQLSIANVTGHYSDGTALTFYSTCDLSKLIDGNPSQKMETKWPNASLSVIITFELTDAISPSSITSYSIWTTDDKNEYAKSWKINVSADGTDYSTVQAISDSSSLLPDPYSYPTEISYAISMTPGQSFVLTTNWAQNVSYMDNYPVPIACNSYPVKFSVDESYQMWTMDNQIEGYPHSINPAPKFSVPESYTLWQNSNTLLEGYWYPSYFTDLAIMGAFAYCENLSSATIPISVTYLGNYTFYGTDISELTISPDTRFVKSCIPAG